MHLCGSPGARRAAAIAIAALAAFVPSHSRAEDPVGPMAGAGGIMRDAERRIAAPLPDKKPNMALTPPLTENKTQKTAKNGKLVGEVAAVAVSGSTEFAEKHGIAQAILNELGEGPKTDVEIREAVGKVKQAVFGKGFYLIRIRPGDGKWYDAASKTLSIIVEEGRFGKISILFDDEAEDGRWFSRDQIERRFDALREGEPFDYSKMRSALYTANSHPDLIIDTEVAVRDERDAEAGRINRFADLVLRVREDIPLHAVWEVNNYGMKEVDEWQTSLTLQYLNLTKHDDVLTLSPAASLNGDLASLAASYMLPHHWWRGGNTTFYGGWSRLDTDDVVPRLDLEGTGWFGGIQHSENIIDDDDRLLAVSAGLLWRYMEDRYTAYGNRLDDRGVSILPVSLALSYTQKRTDSLGGRNFATVQGVFNLLNSGDDLEEMWTGADEHYWILRWQFARLQPLFGSWDAGRELDVHRWMLFSKIEGQYTSDTLVPVEKLSLGGHNCLRGYRTRGYLGDYGIYGTFELRTPILVDAFASLFGDRTDKTAFDRIQFLGFWDWGWTCFNDLPSGYDDDEFICSAGLGFRLAVTKYSQLKCDLAFPMRDTDWADDDDMEVYLSMQMQF